jgi:hypothetical protein
MDDGLDLLHVYTITTSGITFLYDLPSPKRPSGPRHAVLSGYPVTPWAPRLHVLNEIDNSIDTWSLTYPASPLNPLIAKLQGTAVSTLATPAGQDVSTAAELLVSPNGRKYSRLFSCALLIKWWDRLSSGIKPCCCGNRRRFNCRLRAQLALRRVRCFTHQHYL